MKALYLLLLVSGSALADDASILKCRAMNDAAARLGCYDAIQLGTQTAAMSPASAAAPAPVRTTAQNFGLNEKKVEAEVVDKEVTSVESTIVGKFGGWGPGTQIALANGQVWRVIDRSEASFRPMAGLKVRIERNFLGSLLMTIEGADHSPKVRRVK